jgi:hypothetical protein
MPVLWDCVDILNICERVRFFAFYVCLTFQKIEYGPTDVIPVSIWLNIYRFEFTLCDRNNNSFLYHYPQNSSSLPSFPAKTKKPKIPTKNIPLSSPPNSKLDIMTTPESQATQKLRIDMTDITRHNVGQVCFPLFLRQNNSHTFLLRNNGHIFLL